MIKKRTLSVLFFLALLSNGFSQKTKKIDRDSFQLEYPVSWVIDTKDEDYDPDAIFSIDAPDDGGMIMFMIIDLAIDIDELLKDQEEGVKESLIKKPTSFLTFDKWGSLKGKGKTIKGKLLGILKGQVNLFVCTVGDKTLFIMEQYSDEDADIVKDGIATISASFRFKSNGK
jgi:hypothetical protein